MSETPQNRHLEVNVTFNSKESQIVVRSLRKILLAFSARVSLKNIFDQTVGTDTLPVIHGLKVICMGWVILGHTCLVIFKHSGKANDI